MKDRMKNRKITVFEKLAACAVLAVVVAASAFTLNSFSLTGQEDESISLSEKFSSAVNNYSSDVLDGIYYVKREYVIPEGSKAGYEPDENAFAEDENGSLAQAMDDALMYGLYRPAEMLYSADIELWKDQPAKYYLDETIFTVLWKEEIDGCVCNFAEVCIADASQMRRKLSGDRYGAGVRCTATHLAEAANAVVAMSGDYYGYRGYGVTVLDRQLMRNNPGRLDICYVTAEGDFLFEEEASMHDNDKREQYIKDNDIVFSLAFGPVMIKDGKAQEIDNLYSIGQPDGYYARASISQLGKLHYLLFTIDGGVEEANGATVETMRDILVGKGVPNAYTLDGGQTATIVLNNEVFNRVGYGSERDISDIIYFATAIE